MAYGTQYSWVVTLLKGLVAGGGTTGVSAIVQWILDGTTTGDWSMKPETQGIVISLISGAAAALWVMFKNVAKQKWGWVLPALLCVAMLQGCATWSPTEIETTFSDVLGPDGSQNTQYNQKLKAPAGVEAKDLASMTYQWMPDGSGAIAVSSDRSADTMGQAELLKAAFESNNAQVQMLTQSLLGLAGLAVPGIEKKIDYDAAAGAARSQNDAVLRGQILDLLRDPEVLKALGRVRAPRPAAPPADSPGADLPEVGTN
ncbi:MAG: hypothetical protein IT366_21470 [Candidatus Hydrogenedentes bacterium]|nr:hypothetical protein [Candidatus Hydrogenedentota bacterium]